MKVKNNPINIKILNKGIPDEKVKQTSINFKTFLNLSPKSKVGN